MRTSSVLFACLIIITSCNKKLGGFNPSARENFSSQKNKTPLILENTKNAENFPEYLAVGNDFVDFQTTTISQTEFNAENKTNSGTLKIHKKNNFKSHQNIIKSSDIKRNESIQNISRYKKGQIGNDSLKIGVIFLLISAGLAFLPALFQLASLFALVSIIFLIIGLKKLFNRRRKEIQKKQRKEKFQSKKDKIKTFFNLK
jgi:hypothetical protein